MAFLAIKPDSEVEKKRKEERDDPEVYGERWPRQKLRLLDLASREVTTIDALGERHTVEASPSADGSRIAVLAWPTPELDNMSWNGEILIVDVASGEVEHVCDLPSGGFDLAWGSQEPVAWHSSDGLKIEGLLILPSGATRSDGPFPLMTLVHGGPYGRFADALQLQWSRWGQWLATAGYAVLLPNPRGGLGRGDDFADRVAGAVGIGDWADVESGIDHLIAAGIADPERLGIGDWSRGGFMTAWAVGQTNRFKLGVMGAGVCDWGMMVATSDLPHFEAMLAGSTGWEGNGPHLHDALSPISYVGNASTPMLILHGAEDARMPVSQARFFARALREHGVTNELVIYPREPHAIRVRSVSIEHPVDRYRPPRPI